MGAKRVRVTTDAVAPDRSLPAPQAGRCGPATGGGLFDASQKTVGTVPGSDNFTIWWGADLNRFLENATSITPYGSGGGTGLSASGCTRTTASKSDPALTADIFGDWREEVVYRTTGNDALRIYTTTTPTTNAPLYADCMTRSTA